MDLGIAGRRAAVAAASKGLGLGVAKALAAEGVRVAICSLLIRTPSPGMPLARVVLALPRRFDERGGRRGWIGGASSTTKS